MSCHQLLFYTLLFFMGIQNIFSTTCTFSDNLNYKLDWVVDIQTGQIHFVLNYYNFPSVVNAWTGVAFGDSMYSGLDATVVKVLNGQIYVSDEYVQGYQPSWPDQYQDVIAHEKILSNGVLKVRFSRPIKANEVGVDKSLAGCTTWQFITGPGMAFQNYVGKHTRHPESRTVCLDKCRA